MPTPLKTLALGVGSFAQGILRPLRESGTQVETYLTRSYGHAGPSTEGPTFDSAHFPNLPQLLAAQQPDLIIPQSIDWSQKPWAPTVIRDKWPILSPTGDALLLERDRDFSRHLGSTHGIPFPESIVIPTRAEAEQWVKQAKKGFVLKNPLCSPNSPLHTIVSRSADETLAWLPRINDSEGIFLQEYAGWKEMGHIALVSAGEIHSLISNQEYKYAFTGNQGIVAGAPLGGIVELDPSDRYGLARRFLHPLQSWFRETNFHGPVQITAMLSDRGWVALEYNVRLGVTCGPVIMRLLRNAAQTLRRVALNEPIKPEFDDSQPFACSLTLAGQGYPYTQLDAPSFPIHIQGNPTCDVYWNEATIRDQRWWSTGHRIADIVARGRTLPQAVALAYENIARLQCAGTYYRTDVGCSLQPGLLSPIHPGKIANSVGETIDVA